MGIITLRAWRLYRIFIHYLNPGRLISNCALLTALAILVLIDILISTIWTALFPATFQLTTNYGKINDAIVTDQSCIIRPHFYVIFLSYKFSLLLAMIILSGLTHRIPNQTFSTQLLRVFSYLFSITMILGLSLYYFYVLVDGIANVDYYIFSVMTHTLLVIFIALVVAPPLRPVIQHKLKRLSL